MYGETDMTEYSQPAPPTRREMAMMEEEHNMNALATMRENKQDLLRDSAQQVREVVFDIPLPDDIIDGPLAESLKYYYQKASRIPSFDKVSQKKAIRSFADIEDCLGVDQFQNIVKTKLARKILENDLSISRTDRKSSSESGVSSITVQSTKSDYKMTNNSPNLTPSLFDGLLGKK
jgi:hypothetical protein